MGRVRLNERSYPWVLAIFFLVVYLLYPTNLPYIDGLYYSYHVQHMPLWDTFHPHHLLFLTITQMMYYAASWVIDSLEGLRFYQTLNSILGAITLIYIYRLIHAIFKTSTGAFIATFFYGSTFAFWNHSTDANIYISFNLILTILLSRFLLDKDFEKSSHIIVTAVLTAVATLIHQLGIFLLIPYAISLLLNTPNRQPNHKALGLLLSVYLACVLIPYLLVYWLVVLKIEPGVSFIGWVTAYGSNRGFWPFLYHDVRYVVDVIARSQFNAFWHVKPMELIIYDGMETGEGESMRNLFSFTFAVILMLIIERIHFINFRANENDKILYRKLLYWFIPFFVFFMFFVPENYFYRILYLAPLIIFGAGLIQSSTIRDRKNIKPFIFVLVMFTFIYNAWNGIVPESDKMNNPYYLNARAIAEHEEVTENDLVVFADQERYLASTYRYYFDRECLHAMSRPRYIKVTPEQVSDAKHETKYYLEENYQRVFFSTDARRMGVEIYYFSMNNVHYPRPRIMVLDKDQLIQRDVIQTGAGSFFEMRIAEPKGSTYDKKPILIQGLFDSWQPER